jgi:hypothetical protein
VKYLPPFAVLTAGLGVGDALGAHDRFATLLGQEQDRYCGYGSARS